ncbi:MAG: hypothetical protein ACYC6Y_14285 [Thermoguttaceae bacterium]
MSGGESCGCPASSGAGRRRCRGIGKAWLVPLLAAVVAGQATPLYGQSAVGGGLRMDVDTRWPDGPGYRPVRITLTPIPPAVADRTLVVEFTTEGFTRGRRDRLRITRQIELPAGTAPVTAILAVPYLPGHTNYSFLVAENRRPVRGLTASGSFQAYAAYEISPRMILVTDQNVDSATFTRVFLTQYANIAGGTVRTVAVDELRSDWIDYSALDMVCIALDDLEKIALAQPEVFDALLAWTAAGGNLLVFGVGSGWERRSSVERLLELAPSDPSGPDSAWRLPDRKQFGQRVGGIGSEVFDPYADIPVQTQNYPVYNTYRGMSTTTSETAGDQGKAARSPPAPDSPPFASRPFEMGLVVAIGTDNPFDEDAGFWAWLCNHLTSRRAVWYQRHGFSPHRSNPEFFRFLIEGVGKAPLNAFRVLITLFVVVIGPVNYYLLRRIHRLHLLLLTVPASAGIVTLALFAYAVISDGLGTRVRVRSVTRINQATGRTECWARLSYYAGMAPGDGLSFSGDVAVYPLSGLPGEHAGVTRDMAWQDGQRLRSGWLGSRTPTQFLTVRSRKSQIGIDVGPAAAGRLPLTNRLGTDVTMLVARDARGTFYRIGQMVEGAQGEAEAVEGAEAIEGLQAAIQEFKMEYPPGLDASVINNRYGNQYYYAYNTSYYGDFPEATLATSLMEASFLGVTRTSISPLGEFPRGSYVAIVRSSPEVELGTPAARAEQSIHLVLGSW